MADRITKVQRSLNMSHIRGKDTSIEIMVRKSLFNNGFRYRKNVSRLPGKPDIVLPKYKTAIFVNGCFFHHHKNCRLATMPKSNVDYWTSKFDRNIENDIKNKELLEKMGYKVITVWECEIRNDSENRIKLLYREIKGSDCQDG